MGSIYNHADGIIRKHNISELQLCIPTMGMNADSTPIQTYYKELWLNVFFSSLHAHWKMRLKINKSSLFK